VHVCWGEFEGVLEAGLLDGAVFADLACCGDVGDVFVFFGEHEVGFVFAVCLVKPVGLVFIGCVIRWGVVFCHFFPVFLWGWFGRCLVARCKGRSGLLLVGHVSLAVPRVRAGCQGLYGHVNTLKRTVLRFRTHINLLCLSSPNSHPLYRRCGLGWL